MAAIKVEDITTGALDGNGVFDKLMISVSAHINKEREANRISNSDYSTVYLGALEAALAQSVQFVLGAQSADKQAELLAQKTVTEAAQTVGEVDANGVSSVKGTVGKQQELVHAQTAGFTRDAEQKVLKIMMDSYAVQRSTDSALPPPGGAQADDLFAFITKAAQGIGMDVGNADDEIDKGA